MIVLTPRASYSGGCCRLFEWNPILAKRYDFTRLKTENAQALEQRLQIEWLETDSIILCGLPH
jgi:hypothetical protein